MEWISIVKGILELGALGALLILMVKLWCDSNKDWKSTMRENTKELMRIQTEHNKEMSDLIRKYDATLNSVNATLVAMANQPRG